MDEQQNDFPAVGADGPVPQPAADEPAHVTPDKQSNPSALSRRTIFYAAAGAYLIYLAIQLLQGVLTQQTIAWNGIDILCLVAGVVFLAFGLFLLVRLVLHYKRQYDNSHSTPDE